MKTDLKEVGICIRSLDDTVVYQNQLCIDHCGHQLDKRCEKGCLLRQPAADANSKIEAGYKLLKNVDVDGCLVDAVVVKSNENHVTLLFDKQSKIRKQVEQISKFKLSKAELAVVEKYLCGFSNHQIAAQLFISPATLRTHLNNIYKKIPESLKNEILQIHLGKE